jgi:hypothetical protein
MNRAIALLIPFFAIACGSPAVGDTCADDADCEGGDLALHCEIETDATEGTCAEDMTGTPTPTPTTAGT